MQEELELLLSFGEMHKPNPYRVGEDSEKHLLRPLLQVHPSPCSFENAQPDSKGKSTDGGNSHTQRSWKNHKKRNCDQKI